jgi:hypothetical protein
MLYNSYTLMKYLVSFLVLVIFILTGFVAYFFGRQSGLPSSVKNVPISISPAVTETKLNPDLPTSIPKATLIPLQVINGGGILSFPRYQLKAGANWIYTREAEGKDNEKVIIKNGEYSFSITQGGFGGAACLYPGDADIEGEAPSARYTKYVEITTNSGDRLRRSSSEGGQGFGVCQHTQYGWGAPTLYGYISIITPNNPTPEMIKEIDEILASITKI